MSLPFGPPIDPMLARLMAEIPQGDQWRFEPKWDGLRAIAFCDGKDVVVQSRDRRDLARYFPEVVDVLRSSLERPCVLDGEIVLATESGLEFDQLLQRIHPAASRVNMLAQSTPATFVSFDLLALDAVDVRPEPLEERRRRLIGVAGASPEPLKVALSPGPALVTTAQQDDVDAALTWFDELEDVGLDGIIAKDVAGAYIEGKRVMVKVKHHRTADCVVGGYRVAKGGGVGSLLLGLYDDSGNLHYIGFTSAFTRVKRMELLETFKPYEGGVSFAGGRTPGGTSRWSRGRTTDFVSLEPRLVCEVTYDFMQGARFRHAARFVRWRPDKAPRECTLDQLPARAMRKLTG